MRAIAAIALALCFGLACDDMGLPTTREITAAGNTPIPSAAFNAVQDAIIGAKHAEIGKPIHAVGFVSVGANAGVWAPGGGNYWGPGAGGSVWETPIPVPIGDRITRVRFAYKRSSGAGDATVTVFKIDSTGAGGTLATYVDNVHDGTNQIKELAAIYYTAVVDEYYFLSVAIGDNTGPGHLYGATYFHDKL